MKLILILGLTGATLCISMAALGQSKIEAEAELEVKGEIAFPFEEKQISGFEWEYGEGGELFSNVVRNQGLEIEPFCDFSCTMTADIAEDAFSFYETRAAGDDFEHDVYKAEIIATINRQGKFFEWAPVDCSHQEEFEILLTLEVMHFTRGGWIDHAVMSSHGFNPWPVGPCWIDPLSVEITP